MFLKARLADLLAALLHLPGLRAWGRAGLELCWALPLMLLVAHGGGLVRFQYSVDGTTIAWLAAVLFVAPALGEELLFRGILIPRDNPGGRWIAFSAFLFVLWHPLQAVTIGPPWAFAFLDLWFLGVVGILGVALGRIYAATRSLWPAATAHWLVVFSWKAWLGGPF